MVTRTKSHNIDAENALQATCGGSKMLSMELHDDTAVGLTQITYNASQ
jgi:hypothetical protein